MTGPQARDGGPLIALISATPTAIPPTEAAFARDFPQARLWNLLDDRLLVDAEESGSVTPTLVRRMERLIDLALERGADGVLLTCSLYGFVASNVHAPVVVAAPDEAAFADVLSTAPRSVLVIASLESALRDTMARLQAASGEREPRLRVDGVCPPDSFALVTAGDLPALAKVFAGAVAAHAPDAVLLAQYSLAPVADILQEITGKPVVSGPISAAQRFRVALTGA